MKVLFDPVYTTSSPDRCASTAKFVRLARHLLARYPDAYVYWPVPEKYKLPSSMLAFPQDERILYLFMSYGDDRYREYRRLYYQQEKLVAYYGDFWDWDVLVTNRTGIVPLYRQLALHHSSGRERWAKKIMILEDFPQMWFKGSAAVSSDRSQDAQTVLGYYCADATAIGAYWEKDLILESARATFSSSVVRHLSSTIAEASPVEVLGTELKPAEFLRDRSRPFTIGFAGRMVLGHRFDRIFGVMESNWVLRHEWPVECLVSTQSSGSGRVKVPDFVRLVTADRELFWRLMRERVHVGLFFSPEEDYSMSLMEPLMLGVPYAVYRAPWAVASLGPNYPFFVRSEREAHVVVKSLYDDYEGTYELFARWSKEEFEPLLLGRNEVSITTELDKLVRGWWSDFEQYRASSPHPTNAVVQLVAGEVVGSRVPMSMEEAMRRVEEKGKSHHVAKKFEMDQFDVRSVFSVDRSVVRLKLMAHWGMRDASVRPGVLGAQEVTI